mmetsp:Transcript_125615/g.349814  ORF Transcript_125615/g.349814 Transcript_125615/m.349814 type:complete len:204 (+) Transcript_125615:37-648(+)
MQKCSAMKKTTAAASCPCTSLAIQSRGVAPPLWAKPQRGHMGATSCPPCAEADARPMSDCPTHAPSVRRDSWDGPLWGEGGGHTPLRPLTRKTWDQQPPSRRAGVWGRMLLWKSPNGTARTAQSHLAPPLCHAAASSTSWPSSGCSLSSGFSSGNCWRRMTTFSSLSRSTITYSPSNTGSLRKDSASWSSSNRVIARRSGRAP